MAKTSSNAKKGNSKMSVFVIMCFDKSLTIVYEKVIKFIFQIYKFECIRADEINRVGDIVKQIEEEIIKCDLVICDLTYNNPNVFFELGIAHCLKKNIIHITQEPSNIPFDVSTIRMIPYQDTKTGLLDLRDNLSKFIETMFPVNQEYSQNNSKIKYNVTQNNIEEQRFALLSEQNHLKHFAIKFLGDCADKSSFPTIDWIAGREINSDILRDAFWALYKIDQKKAKNILIAKGLRWQKDFLVRERVVSILSNYIPEEKLVDQLLAQLNDTSWGVRRAVCEVFGKWRIKNDVINIKLLTMLHDPEPFVRLAAKDTLEKISAEGKIFKPEKNK